MRLIFVLTFLFSSCKKNEVTNVSHKDGITEEEVISKFHLKKGTNIKKEDSLKIQLMERRNSSNITSNDTTYNVNQTYPFETSLYFLNAQEENDFLSFVGNNPNNVTQYYSSHPDFYKRQLYYNGIIKDTTSTIVISNSTVNEECSNCKTTKVNPLYGNPPCGPGGGNFCQNYLSFFTQMCVGIDYTYENESCSTGVYEGSSSVTFVHIGAEGWVIGFDLHDLGGYGSFVDQYGISFDCNYQISLSIFGAEYYNFPVQTATGSYNIYFGTGYFYE